MENRKEKSRLNDELLDRVSGGGEEILSDSGSLYCDCGNTVSSPLDPSICKNCTKTILREW